MTHQDPPRGPSAQRLSDRAVALLVIETISLGIAIVAPITPSRTGSTWSPAELVTADPSYLEKVAASFVRVNVMIFVIGLVAWIALRPAGSDRH